MAKLISSTLVLLEVYNKHPFSFRRGGSPLWTHDLEAWKQWWGVGGGDEHVDDGEDDDVVGGWWCLRQEKYFCELDNVFSASQGLRRHHNKASSHFGANLHFKQQRDEFFEISSKRHLLMQYSTILYFFVSGMRNICSIGWWLVVKLFCRYIWSEVNRL